jgi:hypothetical protein
MVTTASALDLPFTEAIDFLKQKTATPTKSWRDVWDAAHSKMFMVAGANKQAIVEDFQAAIVKAIETGTTLAEFQKDFDKIVKTNGWSYKGDRGWRTKTIFETNMRTAYAAGRYAQATDPDVLAAFPYWQYNHSGATHPRVQHLAWNGTVLAADDPFWNEAYPPNGFGCGCFVTSVSRGGLKRQGKAGPDRSPNLDQVGTDQPLGIDPSFAYNPGKAWLTQTAPGPKVVTASQAMVAAFAKSSLRGKWPDGSWTPVGAVDKTMAGTLDVKAATEIRLPAETIRSLGETISLETLANLPSWLSKSGRIKVDSQGNIVIVGTLDGKTYCATIRIERQKDRSSVTVTDLKPITARQAAALKDLQ